jgi:hypothetical protein
MDAGLFHRLWSPTDPAEQAVGRNRAGSPCRGISGLGSEFPHRSPAIPKAMGVRPTDDRNLGPFVSRVSFLREQ